MPYGRTSPDSSDVCTHILSDQIVTRTDKPELVQFVLKLFILVQEYQGRRVGGGGQQ